MNDIEQVDDKPVQLPFHPKKQDAVLGHLLQDPRFFMQARNRIKPGWFQEPIAGKVWSAKLKFFEDYQRIPTVVELQQTGDFVTEEKSVCEKMRRKATIACNETANFGLDVISLELQGWLQAIMFKESAQQAQRLYNAQRFQECYVWMDQRMDEIRSARFVDDGEFEFGNISGDIQQEIIDRENACTLGMELLDRTLLPDAPGGSLLPADQTIILAATNTGKTRVLVSIIKHNVMRKKSVLWLAHEGRANDLSMLLWCSMLNVTKPELFQMMRTEEGKRKIDGALKTIKKYVVFIPYMRAGMTVEDVEPIIRNKCEERMARNNGKGFDLCVSDYPAKLGTKLAQGGHMAPRHILDYVYNYHVNLALEYRYHSLVAFQTNRDGAKAQQGTSKVQRDNDRLLVPEDASEAYGPVMTATNVITLNRPPDFKARGLLTFNFCKSRSGETGWAVCCKSDYSKCITHSNKLGGLRYRGTDTYVEQMEGYMAQYFNGTIPEEVALG